VAARTPRTRIKPRAARPDAGPLSYWERSKQPLEILALLVPLVLLYEIGLVRWLASSRGVQTNDAHRALVHLFESFGMDATKLGLPVLSLPAVAMVVVLLVLHVLSRRPWSVDLPTVAGMVVEGALAGLPLYVLVRAVMGFASPGDRGRSTCPRWQGWWWRERLRACRSMSWFGRSWDSP